MDHLKTERKELLARMGNFIMEKLKITHIMGKACMCIKMEVHMKESSKMELNMAEEYLLMSTEINFKQNGKTILWESV